jgi:hypothetical protein
VADIFQALNNAYLKDQQTAYVLTFGYIPEEISDTKAANYAQIDVPGRSEPIFGYISSSAREISLHLKFIAGIGQTKFARPISDDGPLPNTTEIEDGTLSVMVKTRWLQSLVYPDYSTSDYTLPPHTVLLSIGLLIKSECIVNSVNVVYKGPYDGDLLPFIAEVDLSLYEVNPIPKGFQDVRLADVITMQPITTPLITTPTALVNSILVSPTPSAGTGSATTPASNPTIPWGQLKYNDEGNPIIWNGQKYIGIVLGNLYNDPEGNKYIVRGETAPSTWYLSRIIPTY